MVVYHSVENPSKVCVRPYDMFMSEVEKDKYPEATATYRFEKVIIPKIAATEIENAINNSKQDINNIIGIFILNLNKKKFAINFTYIKLILRQTLIVF